MVFRHGKDVPFPTMVRIDRLLRGGGPELVDGVTKAYLAAQRTTRKEIEAANKVFRRKKKAKQKKRRKASS